MARKKKHEEHENHERWLVSYADFITLLFAFFVVMYSLSAVNEGKFRVLSEALVAAFQASPKSMQPIQMGTPSKSPARDPLSPLKSPGDDNQSEGLSKPSPPIVMAPPMQIDAQVREQVIEQMAAEIEHAMEPLIKADLLTVRRDKLWMEIEIKTSILYPSGSARLEPDAVPVLREIARILDRFPNPIRVEGFTDNKPINTVAFPSNWELSAGRAASVVHLFMNAGVDPTRMSAVGLGEYRPVADNSSEAGRNRNRRVVIVVLANNDLRRSSDAGLESGGDPVSPPVSELAPAPAVPPGTPAVRTDAAAPAGRIPPPIQLPPIHPAAPAASSAAPTPAATPHAGG